MAGLQTLSTKVEGADNLHQDADLVMERGHTWGSSVSPNGSERSDLSSLSPFLGSSSGQEAALHPARMVATGHLCWRLATSQARMRDLARRPRKELTSRSLNPSKPPHPLQNKHQASWDSHPCRHNSKTLISFPPHQQLPEYAWL